MGSNGKRLMMVLLVAAFLFVGLTMLNGCKKEEPAPTSTQSGHDHEHGEDGHTHEHSETTTTAETDK